MSFPDFLFIAWMFYKMAPNFNFVIIHSLRVTEINLVFDLQILSLFSNPLPNIHSRKPL